MKTPKRTMARIYGPPAAIASMGAVWMWGDLGAPMRGVIVFSGGVIVLSLLVGITSERRTRRRIAETERRLDLLRTRGYQALRDELLPEAPAPLDTEKEAA